MLHIDYENSKLREIVSEDISVLSEIQRNFSRIMYKFLQSYKSPSGRLRKIRKILATAHLGLLAWDNRSRKRKKLVIIVAGYKTEIWNIVGGRVVKNANINLDICVVTPGVFSAVHSTWCRIHGWSYLATRQNQLSLAQNLAIDRHPDAELIFKLDEDIVIGREYFNLLEETYNKIEKEGVFSVGFVAPLLNVNGFSYRYFLEFMGTRCKNEYKERFGDLRSSCMNSSAWRNPEAARYLWEKSLPFDATVERFLQRDTSYDVCPHRFSIGAFLMQRQTWLQMGGFSRAAAGELGVEEADLCAYCCIESLAMAISNRVFAGHVGFGHQTKVMIPYLLANLDP